MTITAQSVIRRCVETLQDTNSIRWPVDELVRYLNDGQREVALYRPDAMVTNAALTATAGTKQTLPANGAKLIEIIRNTDSKKSIRLCNQEILDAQIPGWHALTPQADAVHYMYDPRDPRTFYVYPPVTGAASFDIVYSAYPADIAEPPPGANYTAVSGDLSLPDIYGNVVQDYVLYRCYTKDSEYAGNAARAQAHYAAFANALGAEIKATVAVQPQSSGNPNTATAVA